MPRRKSYERDEAIEIAKTVFWQHGYHTLGIRGIEEKTGLGRFAINNEFGGKEGLLVEALESYLRDGERHVLNPLREGDSVEAVVGVLQSLVKPSESSNLAFGCLMLNTTIENVNPGNERVKEVTDRYYEELRRTLRGYFARLRKNGVLSTKAPLSEMVEFVVGATIAINFMNRQGGSTESGRGYARAAVRTIRSWSGSL